MSRRRGPPPRRQARVTPSLLAAAAAAAAAAVATAVAGAPPVITRQPPPFVAGVFGSAVTISAAASGAADFQWQRSSTDHPDYWVDLYNGAGTSLTISIRCPYGGDTFRYRLRACNADGCVVSAVSRWDKVTWPVPVWVETPPPVLPGFAMARWVASVPTNDGYFNWTIKDLNGPPGESLRSEPSFIAGNGKSLTSKQGGEMFPVSSFPPGARVVALAQLFCGGPGGGSSDTIQSAPVTAAGPPPLTAACPPFVKSTAADAGGWVLSNGSHFTTSTCARCRANCVRMPGCTTWVWGADVTVVARHRQCWLKARTGPFFPRTTPPTDGPSPWVSGTVPANERTACPGVWAADWGGRVLVAGDTHRRRSCIACEAACRRRPKCNVWVWGFAALGGRHRECWLKRWEGGGLPPLKAGSSLPDSKWLGGLLHDRL
ncbi:hypothetical protein BU14_0076s0011 [Porphyra umbilicalis]|uniref:Apple domain-containing protein n=1 Tax=Porphyra umbilicalis TaxID=2786 RepID=A0A1X6PFD2_PORUM|nr:hypothetical protein BU14_0076s0011 [Porphyra umbilicalis]|eukprot:OSX79455.1 hypothetical protein BU14_0076s0011 [Porphyra umbilicalis]